MTRDPVQRLRAAGLRVTPQRVAVLEALDASSHPTADEVYRRVAARYPQMGLATVYNTLAALARHGQVVAVNMADGRRYDLRTDPHQHIRCRSCGRVDDLPPWDDPGWQATAVPTGWAVEQWTLLAEGVCPACATAAAPSS
jgi:Fur family peroxide stress response transcriptional regulator